MGEWFKPAVLKTADVKASLSSNLSSSASYVEHIVVVATQIVILLVWVRFPLFNPYGISIMDNTVGFYPTNVGSIPACRARDYVSGASWTGTGLQTHGSRFDSCHLFQIMREWWNGIRIRLKI